MITICQNAFEGPHTTLKVFPLEPNKPPITPTLLAKLRSVSLRFQVGYSEAWSEHDFGTRRRNHSQLHPNVSSRAIFLLHYNHIAMHTPTPNLTPTTHPNLPNPPTPAP
jgi:hypothetical protein